MYQSCVGLAHRTRFQSQVSVLQRLLLIPICSLFINILLLLFEIKEILFFIFMFWMFLTALKKHKLLIFIAIDMDSEALQLSSLMNKLPKFLVSLVVFLFLMLIKSLSLTTTYVLKYRTTLIKSQELRKLIVLLMIAEKYVIELGILLWW